MKILTACILLSSSVLLLGCDSSNDPAPPPTGHVKVFLSSQIWMAGNLRGLDGAAEFCRRAADAQGNTGTWTAWLSDKTGNAVDRILDSGGRPYQTLDGTIIANNLADLTDGTLAAPIVIDEMGSTVGSDFEVWSATGIDGKWSTQGTCINWADSSPGFAGIGVAGQTDATWTIEGGGNPCDSATNRLYCFADVVSP
jgi:hypothetical protein